MSPARRRRPVFTALVLAFLIIPVIEIYVLIQVGQAIGAWWTVALLIADSIAGSWLVKHEGSRAWRALREALDSGRMPATELADGALILIGGTLMVAPGFVTDIFAAMLILPITRPLFRRALAAVVARRLVVIGTETTTRWGTAQRPGAGGQGPVVRGDVIDD